MQHNQRRRVIAQQQLPSLVNLPGGKKLSSSQKAMFDLLLSKDHFLGFFNVFHLSILGQSIDKRMFLVQGLLKAHLRSEQSIIKEAKLALSFCEHITKMAGTYNPSRPLELLKGSYRVICLAEENLQVYREEEFAIYNHIKKEQGLFHHLFHSHLKNLTTYNLAADDIGTLVEFSERDDTPEFWSLVFDRLLAAFLASCNINDSEKIISLVYTRHKINYLNVMRRDGIINSDIQHMLAEFRQVIVSRSLTHRNNPVYDIKAYVASETEARIPEKLLAFERDLHSRQPMRISQKTQILLMVGLAALVFGINGNIDLRCMVAAIALECLAALGFNIFEEQQREKFRVFVNDESKKHQMTVRKAVLIGKGEIPIATWGKVVTPIQTPTMADDLGDDLDFETDVAQSSELDEAKPAKPKKRFQLATAESKPAQLFEKKEDRSPDWVLFANGLIYEKEKKGCCVTRAREDTGTLYFFTHRNAVLAQIITEKNETQAYQELNDLAATIALGQTLAINDSSHNGMKPNLKKEVYIPRPKEDLGQDAKAGLAELKKIKFEMKPSPEGQPVRSKWHAKNLNYTSRLFSYTVRAVKVMRNNVEVPNPHRNRVEVFCFRAAYS